MSYRVSWHDNDPEHWIEVDALNAELAAEAAAERICADDCDCYSSFRHGETLHVVDSCGTLRRFKVTVQFEPEFHATEER